MTSLHNVLCRLEGLRLPLVASVLVLLGALGGCATNPVTGDADFVLMSEEQEIAMGKQSHTQIMKQYKPYENPELQSYVEKLGQRLALASHRKHLNFQFTVLDSAQVNAFALPGGYIYITRGIMSYMNSEEELAGVLGHEIGHVTARHGVRQHGAQTAAGVIGVLATIATGSREVAQMSNQLGGALVRGYGRKHELEADRLGAEYLALTDYDPEKMLDVVEILKDQEEFEVQRAREDGREPRVYHGVFSTHPSNDLRLQEVVRAASKFANPNAKRTDPEKFLRLMDGVTFGDSEDQGILRQHRFYHKPLDFTVTFPEGWRVENQPTQLLALRRDGDAVMIMSLDKLEGNEGPEDYMRRTFKGMRDLRQISDGQYTGTVVGKTPYGQSEWRIITVPRNNDQVFVLAGFAKGKRPDDLIVDTAGSIRKLKPEEEKLATPKKIKLVRVRPGDTFEKLARKTNLGEHAEETLRLLNGMYPDGEPETGQLIKTIR